jgi:hypothetical protein
VLDSVAEDDTTNTSKTVDTNLDSHGDVGLETGRDC